ncbi:hypothetical protein NM688_g8780 [Phlebia brevispora]|uniref:Uncharacterized protein n=1 Tax=Phlebia brevispora TaxID=194682 RepID=A0ACC1RQ37_9APHY|nr:hypothetical protein NM688_g8780 [Phlebia brevispora]
MAAALSWSGKVPGRSIPSRAIGGHLKCAEEALVPARRPRAVSEGSFYFSPPAVPATSLLLIYAAILVTYEAGVYDRPLTFSQDTVRTVITIVTQAFTIAYCAVLALLVQHISFQELSKRPQTLTAIHDKSSAWLGLGASLQTLVYQRKLVTDLLGVSMITSYLFLIFIVHTTLPGIFSVTTQNVTTFATYSTTLARQPGVGQILELESGTGPTDLYSILEVYDWLNLTTVGVSNNVLYDIIPAVENTTGAGIEVNATTISVNCTLVPDIAQTDFTVIGASPGGQARYSFAFGGGTYETYAYATSEYFLSALKNRGSDPGLESRFSVAGMLGITATKPVVDSAGNNATTVGINPAWGYLQLGTVQQVVTGVHVFACTFNTSNSTVNVNSQARTINQAPSPAPPVLWHEWTDPGSPSDPLVMDLLQEFAGNAPWAEYDDPMFVFNSTFSVNTTYQPTLLEVFLSADILANRNVTILERLESLSIEELNWSLGRAYAAVLWYYNIVTSLSAAFNQTGAERQQGEASIPSSVLQERLAVNKTSLMIGLVASCVLLILTVALVIRSGDFTSDAVYHDISGLLPILWLLGNEPRLAALEEPDLDALRAAGMYLVDGIDKLRRRTGEMEDKVREDSGEEYELGYPYAGASPHLSDPLLIRTGDTLTGGSSTS